MLPKYTLNEDIKDGPKFELAPSLQPEVTFNIIKGTTPRKLLARDTASKGGTASIDRSVLQKYV